MVNQKNYKIWKKQKIIPGGNMLISKRPQDFWKKNIQFILKNVKTHLSGI